jgi:hypothetical protein
LTLFGNVLITSKEKIALKFPHQQSKCVQSFSTTFRIIWGKIKLRASTEQSLFLDCFTWQKKITFFDKFQPVEGKSGKSFTREACLGVYPIIL